MHRVICIEIRVAPIDDVSRSNDHYTMKEAKECVGELLEKSVRRGEVILHCMTRPENYGKTNITDPM